MCGGAIISGFIAAKRGRKLTKEDLWSELDTISDLLGLDSANGGDDFNPSENRVAPKPKQVSKGEVLCLGFFFWIFGFLRFYRWKKISFFLGLQGRARIPRKRFGWRKRRVPPLRGFGRTCTEESGSGLGENGRRRFGTRTRVWECGSAPTTPPRKPPEPTTKPPRESEATRPSSTSLIPPLPTSLRPSHCRHPKDDALFQTPQHSQVISRPYHHHH